MGALTVGVALVGAAQLAALYVGYRRGDTAAVVNTAAAVALVLVFAALPVVLRDGDQPTRLAGLTFWVAVAGFLHALGMLGRYESVWWWDHLTHTLSAALAAALLYAAVLVAGWSGAAAITLLGTTVLGVLWEVGELIAREIADRYDIEPVLVHYGWRDTAFDLVFDVVGAVLVVALDLRLFVPVVEWVSGAA
ncbi:MULTISPECIES: hypothetical protein [Halolamina]|uniref:Uncharacterized protein n=1 Tax=Halolamina pelagica TaxID=699431 RepID=A0A1I5VHC0_9EURY|nr:MULTISPECIES: hypothetical protein [Halolamina]SFQ06821.1 hypothetical protein SAMN05216277_1186 [Halolamina pelagica]